MSLIWSEARAAFDDARQTINAVTTIATDMARMLATGGMLRKVDSLDALRRLKTELRDFDMTTGKWRKTR